MNGVAMKSADRQKLSGIQAFESGEIDPANFNHEAHVHVAWSYLQEYPLAEAIAKFTATLQALTSRLDIAMKYHETISWFFMIAIADRGALGCPWETFKSINSDLIENGAGLLRRHYSPACLSSPKARRQFVLPDRAP
ncbi:MAG: hypothetical protein ACREQ8_08065 [Woeseiaceae bacterium]